MVNNKISKKLNINDFIVDHYIVIIKQLLIDYSFITYSEIEFDKRFVLWRHDIDFSINRAYHLAKIENKLNIRSTYFVHLQSEFYNPFEKSQHEKLKQIIDLGHCIGLHFDAGFHSVKNEVELEENINFETKFLSKSLGTDINVFSFHNPRKEILMFNKKTYAGLINCYSSLFQEKIKYISDSNGYWRFNRLKNVISESKYDSLQILTHPAWWQDKPMMPRDRIKRSINGRAKFVIDNYDQFLEKNKRKNFGKKE